MSFTQFEFIIIFVFLISALYLIKNNTLKKILLLFCNFYFYCFFSYYFLALLLIVTLSTYAVCKAINSSSYNKIIFLIIGIIINLSILAYFKYYNFFIENINDMLSATTYKFNSLNIIVPIGISFYIFRFISYTYDSYKSSQSNINTPQIHDSLLNFLIYGTFFPIIVSGPISRANHFLPQLEDISLSLSMLYNGFRLFVIGFFLKVFVADRVAPYVNFYFENYDVFNSLSAWIATSAYTIQIYCDFAGYSSMAIGLSSMLGFNIETNFNFPYISTSISEFWKRWHITLSEWIRDYIYIPLGGNRKGTFFKHLNLLIAMTLCGLWHGASLTFIIWGFFHGILLIVNHLWTNISKKRNFHQYKKIYSLFSWGLTFTSISICWIIFRAETLAQATKIIQQLFSFSNIGVAWYQPFVIFIILATITFHILYVNKVKLITLPIQSKLTPTILFFLLWLTIVFYPQEFQPFVYGQF